MPELYCNDPGTQLASDITSSATSMSVLSASGYPSGGNFTIRIENELLGVTATSGATWTITRGLEGTTAGSHLSGAKVNQVLSAGAFDNVRSDMSSLGVFADLPSSGKTGDTYRCTDAPYECVFDGSNWRYFISGYGEVFPPSGTWTWGNQESGATVTTTHGYYTLHAPPTGSNTNYNWQCVSLPVTSPYTHTMLFKVHPNPNTSNSLNSMYAMVLSDGTNTMAWGAYSTDAIKFTLGQWNNMSTNSGGANPGPSDTVTYGIGNFIWIQIVDNGSNLLFNWSIDGYSWTTYATLGRTAHFSGGATLIGFGGFCQSGTYPATINLISFS